MSSLKQIQANRGNSKHSTGPKTDAGKERCKWNAFKHGLASEAFVIDGEDPALLDELIAEMTESHKPESPDEHFLIERIAHGYLMEQRGRHMLQEYFFVAQRGGTKRYIDYVHLVQRYLRETERSVERAYELLFKLKAERRKLPQQLRPELVENGFVPANRFLRDEPNSKVHVIPDSKA